MVVSLFFLFSHGQVKTLFLQWLPWILRMSRPGKKITRKTIKEGQKMKTMRDIKERSSKSLLANVLDMDDDIRVSSSYLRMDAAAAVATSSADMSSPCALAQRDLQAILREIRFVTSRMKKAEEDAEVVADWKFAAMVVDRMCLIVFTSFTIIATVAVLLSAPHIIVQ